MMEEFDIEKDFSKQPYDELPTHKIFPLSENGFKKYIKPKNSFYEFFQKVENDFNSRNRTKNEISNRNKPYVNNTTNDKSNIEKESNKVVKQNKVLCPSRLVKRIQLESKDKELSLSNIKTNKYNDNYPKIFRKIAIFLNAIFEIVPKGLHNCPLSTVHCQLGRQRDKHQFVVLLSQADMHIE